MTLDLIYERLGSYDIRNKISEENAIKEICQEVTLAALSRTDFFRVGAFMGETCLRILYDLPSLFAGKCNAILTRKYVKGRDWYDFLWYVRSKTKINFSLLQSSLEQFEPYSKMKFSVSKQWLIDKLNQKIIDLDWSKAQEDVQRFLSERESQSLKLWKSEFFLSVLRSLESYL